MSGRAPVTRVEKPWGYEIIWANTELYVGKILHVRAGQALSVQYHNTKDQTTYLLSGELEYRVGAQGDTTANVVVEARCPCGPVPA